MALALAVLGLAADALQVLGPLSDARVAYGVAALLLGLYLLWRGRRRWSVPALVVGLVLLASPLLLPAAAPVPPPPPAAAPAPAPASPDEVLFRDDFDANVPWPVGRSSRGTSEMADGGYRLTPRSGGIALWAPATTDRVSAEERIVARARMVEGQGGWGVWCRGDGGENRYEFSVTHAGAAYIKAPGGGTEPVDVPGMNPFDDTEVVATCRDAPDGAGVLLTLTVAGRTIEHLDRGPLLGPGEVGVHAFTFEEVTGTTADVRVESFEHTG